MPDERDPEKYISTPWGVPEEAKKEGYWTVSGLPRGSRQEAQDLPILSSVESWEAAVVRKGILVVGGVKGENTYAPAFALLLHEEEQIFPQLAHIGIASEVLAEQIRLGLSASGGYAKGKAQINYRYDIDFCVLDMQDFRVHTDATGPLLTLLRESLTGQQQEIPFVDSDTVENMLNGAINAEREPVLGAARQVAREVLG